LTFLTGLTGELYRPASSALLTDLVPAGQRVTAFSAYRLSFNAGWAFGPATAGLLAVYSFLFLFAGDAFTSVLFGIVAWRFLPDGAPTHRNERIWTETWEAIRKDRPVQLAMLASLFIGVVFWQMPSTY